MGTEKFCTTANVTVDNKKKAKHHHTTGKRMKAKSFATPAPTCERAEGSVLSDARFSTKTKRTKAYRAAAATKACRQPQSAPVTVKNTGATAQPRLPLKP